MRALDVEVQSCPRAIAIFRQPVSISEQTPAAAAIGRGNDAIRPDASIADPAFPDDTQLIKEGHQAERME
jgi:hypothetical protein